MHESQIGVYQVQNPRPQEHQYDDITLLAQIAASFDRKIALQALSPYVAPRLGLIKGEAIEDWHSILETLADKEKKTVTAGLNILLRNRIASVGRIRDLSYDRVLRIRKMGPIRAGVMKSIFPSSITEAPQES